MLTFSLNSLPSVVMTGKTRANAGWGHAGRTLEVNLLFILHSGDCTVYMLGSAFSLQKGDVMIVPKGTFYRPYSEEGYEFTFFHFTGDFSESESAVPLKLNRELLFYGKLSEADRVLPLDYRVPLGDKAGAVDRIISELMPLDFYLENSAKAVLYLRFAEILLHASEAYSIKAARGEKYPPALDKILSVVRADYKAPFSLDSVCARAGVSKQYAARLFRRYLHTTVGGYVTDLKMRHAVYLLRHTNQNESEVASYLGYSSVSYFSQAFKSYYGLSPTRYLWGKEKT